MHAEAACTDCRDQQQSSEQAANLQAQIAGWSYLTDGIAVHPVLFGLANHLDHLRNIKIPASNNIYDIFNYTNQTFLNVIA